MVLKECRPFNAIIETISTSATQLRSLELDGLAPCYYTSPLSTLTNPTSLSITDCYVSYQALAGIFTLSQLQSLSLYDLLDLEWSDRASKWLARSLPQLTHLELSDNGIEADQLSPLSSLPKLQQLSVADAGIYNTDMLDKLADLPFTAVRFTNSNQMSSRLISWLRRHSTRLQNLGLRYEPSEDELPEEEEELEQFSYIQEAPDTARVLAALSSATQLTSLAINSCDLCSSLRTLQALTSLKELIIEQCEGFDDGAVCKLSVLSNLQLVDFPYDVKGEQGSMQCLAHSCPQLWQMRLRPEAFAAARSAFGPRVCNLFEDRGWLIIDCP